MRLDDLFVLLRLVRRRRRVWLYVGDEICLLTGEETL